MRALKWWFSLLFAMFAGLANAASLPQLHSRVHPQVIVVSQAVSGIDTPSAIMKVNHGPLNSSASAGFDLAGKTNAIEAQSAAAPAMAMTTYGNGTQAQDAILANSNSFIQSALSDYVPKLVAYAKALNVSRIYYTLDQEIMPSGATHSKRLVWTMAIDDAGHASYGQPQIYDASPGFVYISYTPLMVTSGLPQNWQYINAGIMTYQLFSTKGTALSSPVKVDTKGAFDAPQSAAAGVDDDAGLKCLVGASTACAGGNPTAISLINKFSASFAIVDYLLMVQPVYNTVETPAGSGTYAQVPAVSIGVTQRSWYYQTCSSKTFYNAGYFGYTLLTAVDRYYVDTSANYSLEAAYRGQSASPYQNYAWARGITDSEFGGLSALMIDPTTPGSALLNAASVPNLVAFAALTETASQAPTTYSVTSIGSYGRTYDQSAHDHIIEFSGSSSDNYNSATTYSGSVSFSIANVAEVASARLVSVTGAQVVTSSDVNNNTIYSNGLYGGRVLKCGATNNGSAGVWPGVSPSDVPMMTSGGAWSLYCYEGDAWSGTTNVCWYWSGDQLCQDYTGTWFHGWVPLNNSGISQDPNDYPNSDLRGYLGAGVNTVSFRAVPANTGSRWDIKFEIIDACN